MIKFLQRINKAYDNIAEPRRFMLFMAMIIPAIVAISQTTMPNVLHFGWMYILAMLVIRMAYIHGLLKSE